MAEANFLLIAVSVAILVPVYRRHRQIIREKRALLLRLERLAQHHDLFRQ